MLLKDNRRRMATIIMKRMKGSHGDMSPSYHKNVPQSDENGMEEMHSQEGSQKDTSMAQEHCCYGMMGAIERKDPKAFRKHLIDFLEMVEEENESSM